MADMSYSDDEKRVMAGGLHVEPAVMEKHPYGLRISLTERELVKLGIEKTDVPQIGDLIHFAAMAKLTHYSDSEDGGRRVELQIIDMLCWEDENQEGVGEDDDDAS